MVFMLLAVFGLVVFGFMVVFRLVVVMVVFLVEFFMVVFLGRRRRGNNGENRGSEVEYDEENDRAGEKKGGSALRQGITNKSNKHNSHPVPIEVNGVRNAVLAEPEADLEETGDDNDQPESLWAPIYDVRLGDPKPENARQPRHVEPVLYRSPLLLLGLRTRHPREVDPESDQLLQNED